MSSLKAPSLQAGWGRVWPRRLYPGLDEAVVISPTIFLLPDNAGQTGRKEGGVGRTETVNQKDRIILEAGGLGARV